MEDSMAVTARALMGMGEGLRALDHGKKLRLITHIRMPPGTVLGAESCKAKVYRPKQRWWWECRCGESGSATSWQAAFRRAHRHVKLSRLLVMVAELERESD
jgi:hypothetical protein